MNSSDKMNGARDFDFFAGSWDVEHRRLRQWLAGCDDWDEFGSTAECWPLFDGAANVDELSVPERGFTGLSLRLLDPARGDWTIYWANSRDGRLQPPVTGRFSGGVGVFHGDDVHEGRPVRVRYTWSGITAASARWEQAYSADGEQTWEVNWIMDFTRRADRAGRPGRAGRT
jgi:hypothetical protein